MLDQKRVWLHRVKPKGNLPEEVRKNATRRLSSVFKNNKPLKGLNREEEKEILPKIIDATPEEGSDFYEKVSRYWKELNIDVPSGGKDLDISTRGSVEKNDKTVADPVNPRDYVMYKFAKAHPQVAESEEEAKKNPNKLYWILDPQEEKREKKKDIEYKEEAWKEFIEIKEDSQKIDLMIRVFTDDKPSNFSDIDEKTNRLYDELERRPKEFVEVAKDDDLEKQDFVLQCIEKGVLRKVGNQIMFEDEVLGTGTEEVVAYLKNERNSSTLSTLKAKLQEAK